MPHQTGKQSIINENNAIKLECDKYEILYQMGYSCVVYRWCNLLAFQLFRALFTWLHETETDTVCNPIILNSERHDGSS